MTRKNHADALVEIERDIRTILSRGSVKITRDGERTLYEVENFDEVDIWIEKYNEIRFSLNRSLRSVIKDKIDGMISAENARLGRKVRSARWNDKNSVQ